MDLSHAKGVGRLIGLGWRGRWPLVALGGLIPLIAFIFLLIQEIRALQYGAMESGLRSRTAAAASALESYLSFQLGQIATLASSPLLEGADFDMFYLEMVRASSNHPEWLTFILSDGRNQLLNAKYPMGATLPAIVDPDSLREVFSKGRPSIGNLAGGRVALRQPVIQEGHVRYVLSAVVEPWVLNNILVGQHVPQGWLIQLYDGNQTVIARNVEPELRVGMTASDGYHRVREAAAGEMVRMMMRDGQEAFAAIAPVQGTGWRVGVAARVSTVAAPYRKIEQTLYAGAGVAAFAAAAILLLIFRQWRYAFDSEGRQLTIRAETAETASREKSAFLANMSHEMRTPLNAVIGFAEMLENAMFGPLGHPKNAEYVRDIAESGRHLLALINDLLDLSKIEAGKMEIDWAQIELAEMVQAVLTLVRENATRKGVSLASTVAPGSQVMADPRLLRQMLVNLVSNAVKYTPAGGVTVSASPDDRCVRIVVRDTGVGMTEDELRRSIEPYSRGDSNLARKQVGTGLGLTLTKRLIELHGGTLTIESKPGFGTTATIILPHRGAAAADDDHLEAAA